MSTLPSIAPEAPAGLARPVAVSPYDPAAGGGTREAPGADIDFPTLVDGDDDDGDEIPLPPISPDLASMISVSSEQAADRQRRANFDSNHLRPADRTRATQLDIKTAAAGCAVSPIVLVEFHRRCTLAGLVPADVLAGALVRAIQRLPRDEREAQEWKAKNTKPVPPAKRQRAVDFDPWGAPTALDWGAIRDD